MQKKLHQHKYYNMGKIVNYEISKYEKDKNRMSKHLHLATFRKSYQCCNVNKCDIWKGNIGFVITRL